MYAVSNVVNRSGLRLIAISSLIIGLAACGGGSSSGGGGGGSTLPTTPVTISSTNQGAVAGAAVDAAIGGTGMTVTGVQTSPSAPSAVATAQKVGKIGLAAARRIAAQSAMPATVTGVVQSFPCGISGTVSFDPAATTSNTLTYTNCSDIAGETINGTVSIINITNTTSSYSADTVFNITFVDPTGTGTAKGDMHVAQTGCSRDAVTNALQTCAATMISGTSLAMNDTVYGGLALQNYSMTTDANGNITAMTFTFASTVIGGTATFNLVTAFGFTGTTTQFPSSGAATITGAGSTKLKITALGNENAAANSQVQLELSTDNGTTYGTPTLVTWASISDNL